MTSGRRVLETCKVIERQAMFLLPFLPSFPSPLPFSNLICLLTALDPIQEPIRREKMYTLHCWSLALYHWGLSSMDYMNQQLLQMEPPSSAISHVGFCS